MRALQQTQYAGSFLVWLAALKVELGRRTLDDYEGMTAGQVVDCFFGGLSPEDAAHCLRRLR